MLASVICQFPNKPGEINFKVICRKKQEHNKIVVTNKIQLLFISKDHKISLS